MASAFQRPNRGDRVVGSERRKCPQRLVVETGDENLTLPRRRQPVGQHEVPCRRLSARCSGRRAPAARPPLPASVGICAPAPASSSAERREGGPADLAACRLWCAPGMRIVNHHQLDPRTDARRAPRPARPSATALAEARQGVFRRQAGSAAMADDHWCFTKTAHVAPVRV